MRWCWQGTSLMNPAVEWLRWGALLPIAAVAAHRAPPVWRLILLVLAGSAAALRADWTGLLGVGLVIFDVWLDRDEPVIDWALHSALLCVAAANSGAHPTAALLTYAVVVVQRVRHCHPWLDRSAAGWICMLALTPEPAALGGLVLGWLGGWQIARTSKSDRNWPLWGALGGWLVWNALSRL